MTAPLPVPAELEPWAAKGWEIVLFPAGLRVISAEKRDERGGLRYHVAHTPRELAEKLEQAEQEEGEHQTTD